MAHPGRRLSNDTPRRGISLLVLNVLLYFLLQSILVVLHEHAHSTAAWLLGRSATPFTVVWGNPLTMHGWDEGVPYDQLFPVPGHFAESIIGGIPLLLHSTLLVLALSVLTRPRTAGRPVLLATMYWLAVANFAELIAYLVMRPFIPTGDTGRFNHGLGLSPWPLFLTGLAFLLSTFLVFLRRGVPFLPTLAGHIPWVRNALLCLTAFFMWLWASGLRMLSLYPEHGWATGLIGVAAFILWVVADLRHPHPTPARL